MTRIAYASDLHAEFSGHAAIAETDADHIILAGDIHKADMVAEWANKEWPDKQIICVAGNHEFYNRYWKNHEINSDIEIMRRNAKLYDNIHSYLNIDI